MEILIAVSLLYWFATILLFLAGFVMIFINPDKGKKFLVASGVMFLVGGGLCGAFMALA